MKPVGEGRYEENGDKIHLLKELAKMTNPHPQYQFFHVRSRLAQTANWAVYPSILDWPPWWWRWHSFERQCQHRRHQNTSASKAIGANQARHARNPWCPTHDDGRLESGLRNESERPRRSKLADLQGSIFAIQSEPLSHRVAMAGPGATIKGWSQQSRPQCRRARTSTEIRPSLSSHPFSGIRRIPTRRRLPRPGRQWNIDRCACPCEMADRRGSGNKPFPATYPQSRCREAGGAS